MDLSHISNHELLSDMRALIGEERAITAKLVAYLGEVEERRLHLVAGFPSMFAFCTQELGMSENEAFRRLVAARLARRFPVIHSLLGSGAVHLSALELLREHLTEENHAELLEAVSGKSKNEVLAVLARRFPKPDVPTTVRKLPLRLSGMELSRLPIESTTSLVPAFEPRASSGERVLARERMNPLSPTRYEVKFTASVELREKLELCRDLMSHANPSRELGAVVERAVDLLLAELEKNRLGRTKRSRREPAASRQRPTTRSEKHGHIASAMRRQVFERDGLRCTYVSPDGRRCEARAFLELDHREPRALGGADSVDNLRVRCRAHNQFSAEQVFGRENIAHCRHFGRQKSAGPRVSDNGAHPQTTPPSACERLDSALRSMGFRVGEARKAVARVASMHGDLETLPIEQSLREAVLAATAGS